MGHLISAFLKKKIKDTLGITHLNERVDELEKKLLPEDEWERSRVRWTRTLPEKHLTWGRKINGSAFINKIASYNTFSAKKNVLEIGPGYGRIFNSFIKNRIPFNKYIGVDISINNVEYLSKHNTNPNVSFINGDIESINFNIEFDNVYSSLTFKHLYPTFEKGLKNILQYVKNGGYIFFDLLEGEKKIFEQDEITYINHYSKKEVDEIITRLGLKLIDYSTVVHNPKDLTKNRLLIVVQK